MKEAEQRLKLTCMSHPLRRTPTNQRARARQLETVVVTLMMIFSGLTPSVRGYTCVMPHMRALIAAGFFVFGTSLDDKSLYVGWLYHASDNDHAYYLSAIYF